MARSEALINGDILRWAIKRARLDLESAAEKLKTRTEVLSSWIGGKTKPTFRQAEKAANALNIPFGYLFLTEIPEEKVTLPDLRTIEDIENSSVSPELRDLIADIQYKFEWYKEYLISEGAEELNFVGSASIEDSPRDIAVKINETFEAIGFTRAGSRTYQEYARNLMRASEDLGIWVMRSGIVGNNTHRPLSVAEFRGFAIADNILPVVFINGKDAVAAQIFTLAHELVHIWLGESGISNSDVEGVVGHSKKVEKLCNAAAAEFLVPKTQFMGLWQQQASIEENSDITARAFKVSTAVTARRARDLNLVSDDAYRNYFKVIKSSWLSTKASTDGQGNLLNTIPVRYGGRFTDYVVSSAKAGDMLFRDAANLLHVRPTTIEKLAAQSR